MIFFHIKEMILLVIIFVKASGSTYFVKYSTTTKMNYFFSDALGGIDLVHPFLIEKKVIKT
jgi:hypothetical protein